MSSVAHPSREAASGAGRADRQAEGRVRLASCTLTEQSFVCEAGGGFETVRWSIRINDGWLTTSQLTWRKAVGGVTADLLEQDDPTGATRQKWADRSPQVYFHRRIHVVAPIGTRFLRRVWKPGVDRSKSMWDYLLAGELSPSQRRFDEYFELRGDDRLVSVRALMAKRPERAAAPAEKLLSREETRRQVEALLSKLEAAPRGGVIANEVEATPEDGDGLSATGAHRRDAVRSTAGAGAPSREMSEDRPSRQRKPRLA